MSTTEFDSGYEMFSRKTEYGTEGNHENSNLRLECEAKGENRTGLTQSDRHIRLQLEFREKMQTAYVEFHDANWR